MSDRIETMPFSVLMSVYEDEKPSYLRLCLQSLVDQTIRPSQVVIVQDGILGLALLEVISDFERILDICSPQLATRKGLAAALNFGLDHCRHELIARMDADDVALPNRFEVQLSEFELDPLLDIVGGYAQEIDQEGNLGCIRKMPLHHNQILECLYACPLNHPSVMYRRSKIISVGRYNDELSRRQDYELWFRCALAGFRFKNVSNLLILYRFTSSTHNRQTAAILFRQGCVGMIGVIKLRQPIWKGCVAFYPFLRSILPGFLQHFLYIALRRFDPRRK